MYRPRGGGPNHKVFPKWKSDCSLRRRFFFFFPPLDFAQKKIPKSYVRGNFIFSKTYVRQNCKCSKSYPKCFKIRHISTEIFILHQKKKGQNFSAAFGGRGNFLTSMGFLKTQILIPATSRNPLNLTSEPGGGQKKQQLTPKS